MMHCSTHFIGSYVFRKNLFIVLSHEIKCEVLYSFRLTSWYSVVDTTVTVHQFFCILHQYISMFILLSDLLFFVPPWKPEGFFLKRIGPSYPNARRKIRLVFVLTPLAQWI